MLLGWPSFQHLYAGPSVPSRPEPTGITLLARSLHPRQCAQLCGQAEQYCCAAGETCFTAADHAGCLNTGAGGGAVLYTTTWTEAAQTYTSTITSFIPAATGAAGQACVPALGLSQIACGSVCCSNWQYCVYQGQCMGNIEGRFSSGSITKGISTTKLSTPATSSGGQDPPGTSVSTVPSGQPSTRSIIVWCFDTIH